MSNFNLKDTVVVLEDMHEHVQCWKINTQGI